LKLTRVGVVAILNVFVRAIFAPVQFREKRGVKVVRIVLKMTKLFYPLTLDIVFQRLKRRASGSSDEIGGTPKMTSPQSLFEMWKLKKTDS
jgi:hypothetical protein